MTPAQRITLSLGGKWHGTYGEACCPAHDDSKPSLSVRDGERAIVFHCFRGCTSIEVARALTRRHLIRRRHEPRRRAPIRTSQPAASEVREFVEDIWRQSQPLGSSIGARYLVGRSIVTQSPPTLRFHRGLRHGPTGLVLPAMVAAIQAPDRSVCAIQRTFLVADGSRKAPVTSPKMTLGPMGAGAVRLGAAAERLGIAEGIETGLSALQLFGVPVWCSLGAERLGKIELPPIVRRVLIFGDRGAEAQAERAADAYRKDGLEVEIRYPDPPHKDFNDVAQARSTGA